MSADYRQQQEIEELEQWLEENKQEFEQIFGVDDEQLSRPEED